TFEYRGERGALATWDNDRWRNGVRGFYRRRFTQGLSMRLGYGYERFTTEEQLGELMRSRPIQGHWFDVGVDYSRDATINLTRRTTLSFDMGTKMLADIDRRRFDVVGSAVLHREIGRTWSAALAYNRN